MTHSTHKTRISDSSLYDEVCVYCGATDARNDTRLSQPCPATANDVRNEPYSHRHKGVKAHDC